MDPVVIVGSGLAGYTVAKELRKLDPAARIVLLTRDEGAWYSKPMLSNALSARKTAEQLAASTAAQMAAQFAIEVRPHTEVIAIAPELHDLHTNAGTLRYARLVLALGADPVPLQIEGAAEHTLAVNDLGDYARFRRALDGARRVTILGAGLIGCEFANDLAANGSKVSVVEPGEWPLGRLAPEAVGRALQAALAEQGIEWHLGTVAQRIARERDHTRVYLSSGGPIDADVVLTAVGLRPRIELASAAGLAVSRGIVTDRFLATSKADIYALGDCAQVNGRHLPYVLPIMHCARALAKTLRGESTAVDYPVMPVTVKTPALPVTLAPPDTSAAVQWRVEGSGRDIAAICTTASGAVAGFALTGAATARKAALVGEISRGEALHVALA